MPTHDALGYFSFRFDEPVVRAPTRRYAIVSSQRTGSNWLCARLCNLEGRLGVPMEYLHGKAIAAFGARLLQGRSAVPLDDYLDAVEQVRTTADGWFGIKVQPNQLAVLLGSDIGRVAALLSRFDRVIFLERTDKLAQAVSCAVAELSGTWFNFGDEPVLASTDASTLFPVVEAAEARFVREAALMRALASRLPAGRSIAWTYEQLLAAPQQVFAGTLAHLGITADEPLHEVDRVRPTVKPPTAQANRLRAAYEEWRVGRAGGPAGNAQSTRNG